jgi:hypothetical protein
MTTLVEPAQRIKTKPRKIACNNDVEEVVLIYRNLREVEDLSHLKNLHRLWLNGNKLSGIDFLSHNYRLSELYLQDNRLSSIAGALGHLQSLQILFLHNNQLQSLTEVLCELQYMTGLRHLNLFGNPLCYQPGYRLMVIFNIPSLQIFDRSGVQPFERRKALQQLIAEQQQ